MKYLIKFKPNEYVTGIQVQTKGNDEEFPTFLLDDGRLIGVDKKRVVGKYIEE